MPASKARKWGHSKPFLSAAFSPLAWPSSMVGGAQLERGTISTGLPKLCGSPETLSMSRAEEFGSQRSLWGTRQYESWLMLNCSELGESMIAIMRTLHDCEVFTNNKENGTSYIYLAHISSGSQECSTAGTSATLWSYIGHGRWWRKPDGLITFADFLIKDRD